MSAAAAAQTGPGRVPRVVGPPGRLGRGTSVIHFRAVRVRTQGLTTASIEADSQQREGIIREQEGIQPVRNGAGPVRQGRRRHQSRRGHPGAAPQSDARVLVRDPGPHGRRHREGVPRLPRPAQRRPRPGQGRHPLPSARDARHGPRPRDVDDVEVLGGGHPARRRQGRRDLRSAQPEPARAAGDLPRLDPPDGEERRPGQRRARARRHDQPAAHAVDAGRVRDDSRRPVPRLHHRQAGGHGRLARAHRGHRLRLDLHRPRGAARDGPQGGRLHRVGPGLRQRVAVRRAPVPAARRQGHLRVVLGPGRPGLLHVPQDVGPRPRRADRASPTTFGGIDKGKAKKLGYEVLPGRRVDRAGSRRPAAGRHREPDHRRERRTRSTAR